MSRIPVNVEMAPRTRRFMRELTGADSLTENNTASDRWPRGDARRQRAAKALVIAFAVPLFVVGFTAILWLHLGAQLRMFG